MVGTTTASLARSKSFETVTLITIWELILWFGDENDKKATYLADTAY